jgi:hypothetical protein
VLVVTGPAEVPTAAWAETGRIFAHAGVTLLVCDHGGVATVKADTSRSESLWGELGVTIHGTGDITLMLDRVRRMATHTGPMGGTTKQYGKLLGRVIAHELGHVVLGIRAPHPLNGIMASPWSPERMMKDDPRDWRFSKDEARRLVEVLTTKPVLHTSAPNQIFGIGG